MHPCAAEPLADPGRRPAAKRKGLQRFGQSRLLASVEGEGEGEGALYNATVWCSRRLQQPAVCAPLRPAAPRYAMTAIAMAAMGPRNAPVVRE